MPQRQLKKSDTDGYAAVRCGVECTLDRLGMELSEPEMHQLTLEAMHSYASRLVPRHVPHANHHRAAEMIADRFRQTDLRGRLDVGYGI